MVEEIMKNGIDFTEPIDEPTEPVDPNEPSEPTMTAEQIAVLEEIGYLFESLIVSLEEGDMVASVTIRDKIFEKAELLPKVERLAII